MVKMVIMVKHIKCTLDNKHGKKHGKLLNYLAVYSTFLYWTLLGNKIQWASFAIWEKKKYISLFKFTSFVMGLTKKVILLSADSLQFDCELLFS